MTHAATSLIGTGLYPLPRAAQLAGVSARTARRWLAGDASSARNGVTPLWQTQHAQDKKLGPACVLGFQDLLELRSVVQLVNQGLSLSLIRTAMAAAREVLGDYPLHARRFVTDGKTIFLDALHRAGRRDLLDLPARQYALEAVIRPSLIDGIEYDAAAVATRWFPQPRSRRIVLDPQVQFGEPVIARAGIATATLSAAAQAEDGDTARVARWYGVTARDVHAAMAFEAALLQ